MAVGGILKLQDGGSSAYTGFKASDTSLTTDVIYELPDSDGADGEVLTTGGNKKLLWKPITLSVGDEYGAPENPVEGQMAVMNVDNYEPVLAVYIGGSWYGTPSLDLAQVYAWNN